MTFVLALFVVLGVSGLAGASQLATGQAAPAAHSYDPPRQDVVRATRAQSGSESNRTERGEQAVEPSASLQTVIAAEGAGRGLSSVDDVLGGLSKGRQPSVRTVGSDRELQGVYDDLARGGSPIEVPGYKGTWVERPDGLRIGLRDVSKSGGRTIDVRLPDGTIFKVHIG